MILVMPYYIGVSLQQDTVSFHAAGSSLDYVPQSILLCCSILRMFCLFRVFRPFRYTHTKLIYPHDDCLRLLNPELRSSRVLLSFGCHLRYRTTGQLCQCLSTPDQRWEFICQILYSTCGRWQ